MPDTATKEPATVGELLDNLPPVQRGEVITEAGALALAEPATPPVTAEQPSTLLAAILNASCDPRVDVVKLQALMTMQERLEERQAEREFTSAYARLSAKLPRVKKNGTIELGKEKDGPNKGQSRGSIPFAKWEDMDKIIRPLLGEEGFSLSFDTAPRQADGGGLVVTGTLLHRDGHTRTASMPLPLDTGPGRNNLQAMGSTLSYGKRYCAEMLLNIVREGADDDGKTGSDLSLISDEQKEKLVEKMREVCALLKDPVKFQQRFNARFKINALDELPASAFKDAHGALVETINANKKPDAA